MYNNNVDDMVYNTLFAFYLGCANKALQFFKYASKAKEHDIPDKTFQDAMSNAGHFVGRAIHYPRDLPFCADKTQEMPVKEHFGEVKKNFRGMVREKDMIYGT